MGAFEQNFSQALRSSVPRQLESGQVGNSPAQLSLANESFGSYRPSIENQVPDLAALAPSPTKRSLGYLLKQFVTPMTLAETGLSHLTTAEFLTVAREKQAFAFAIDTPLRQGWWTSLLQLDLLSSSQGLPFKNYLKKCLSSGNVVEIGPGDSLASNRKTVRKLGASEYVGIDKQDRVKRLGGIQMDALEYFSQVSASSVDVIMAFGVFNEPMSLQYPAGRPPYFTFPAKNPAQANRAHAEHEYVRRLAAEMHRALKPDGILLGDGLHSRGFEREVEWYLTQAGFGHDKSGYKSLETVSFREFGIRDPFFLKKGSTST